MQSPMQASDKHTHWENIYKNKNLNEVSWYQPTPAISLEFLDMFNLPVDAKIIDIGGGDSFFVDHLLERGYTDITVLDISETAIARARKRLGIKADAIKWIVSDILNFVPNGKYDFWHDRATFHFFTSEEDIEKYIGILEKGLKSEGNLLIGSFSEKGPEKCSGLQVTQYSEKSMSERMKGHFEKIKCISIDHKTPFNTIQNFVFCGFNRFFVQDEPIKSII